MWNNYLFTERKQPSGHTLLRQAKTGLKPTFVAALRQRGTQGLDRRSSSRNAGSHIPVQAARGTFGGSSASSFW